MTAPTSAWPRWTGARRHRVLVVAAGIAVVLPYLIAGPGLFVDDWFALRNAVTSEWWRAAGTEQWRARPGAAAVYAGAFGLIGANPRAHAVVAGLLIIATALLLVRVLRRFVPPEIAVAVTVVWLVVPNHMSLETWASTLNISAALLLLLVGVDRLTSAPEQPRAQWAAAAAFGVSMLCYEATAPASTAVACAVAWTLRRRDAPFVPLLVRVGLVQLAVAAWMVANWHPAKEGLDVWMDPVAVVDGHIGASVVGEHIGASLLGAIVLLISAVAAYLLVRGREHGGWQERLIIGGWVVVVLGAMPFLRYFYSPVGLGDRVTVVSGVGGAAVLVGSVGWVARRERRIAIALVVMVAAGVVGNRVSLTRDFATAADDSRRILSEVERRWPSPPEETVVFGPFPVVKRNIVAFIDADWPLQWLYADREVSAGFTLTREAFESFPESARVDLHELSRLEAIDRIGP